MKYYDLTYVEDELIAGIESFIPDCQNYLFELQEKAQGLAAAKAAKEQALKNGTAGLGEVVKKQATVPISPKITRPRPPRLPEPIEIEQNVIVNEVPTNLNKITLQDLEEMRLKRLEENREKTLQQYDEKYHFKLHEGNSGRSIDDIRREVEEEKNKELKFDSTFVNEPPDFNKIPAKIRLNAAAILREDSLLQKQQMKDVKLLKNYELELRDSSEYYLWQQEMKERDEKEKLYQINLRRQQAKISAEEAKNSIIKQHEDNFLIANILREQSEEIKLQKQLENEIALITNKEQVQNIIQERETKPKESKQKVLEIKQLNRIQLQEELERKQKEKELQDSLEEEIRADNIRQLKALNNIHKNNIKIFDETKVDSKICFLSEMSYMEMKERLKMNKANELKEIENKNSEINQLKESKALLLKEKANSIMSAREIKSKATRERNEMIKQQKIKEENEAKLIQMKAAEKLNQELLEKRTLKEKEQEALKKETERIQRQQQYLGLALGRVEETRAEQMLLGSERKVTQIQNAIKSISIKNEEVKETEKVNRKIIQTKEKKEKRNILLEQDMNALRERRIAIEKMKEEYQLKKEMVRKGHQQHDKTKDVVKNHNLYADRINHESIERSRSMRANTS